ncbi:glycosyltransferase [Butyrivibrio sp. NC3005]|uniref:glycosyltransferase n=1 Tax=Butyrivibrio sp. NC3005 TaxID=1280685 RepID=UPI0003FA528D|nr:glycosyltransferase [Butyrivibrio sp. NC3005]
MEEKKVLSVTIVTPTFNSMRTLDNYMEAIVCQTYPHEKIDIVIADGGSTDGTLERLEDYKKKYDIEISVFHNKLRTAEAGKAVGVRKAKGDVVLLLDSDNIIPKKDWMERMMAPFEDEEIIASEPIKYTYRKKDSVINRYCALIGMNDPLCMFTGNYDRYCCLTGKWTEVEREEKDMGDYLSIKFREDMIPTIGANGFFMRTKELIENFEGDYLFDIDVLWELFKKNPELRVAKVKTGIVHLFCPDLATFKRKQNRRIQDFLFFSDSKGRKYPWSKVGKGKIVKFALCCITVLPLLFQSIKGFAYKKDIKVWLCHPIMCWITLWVYGIGTIRGLFHKEEADRSNWKQ